MRVSGVPYEVDLPPPADDELFELVFDALVPFANIGILSEGITQKDVNQAREILRLISIRITIAKQKKKA